MLIDKQTYLMPEYNHNIEFLSSNAFSKCKSRAQGVSWVLLAGNLWLKFLDQGVILCGKKKNCD